jgi:hypothetical protein
MPITVPNCVIEIIDSTSRIFYEPGYVVPLLRALWSGVVSDPLKDIVVREPSNPFQKAQATIKFDGTLDEFIAYEEQRLRNLYGVNPRTNGLLFDIIYPGNLFALTVRKLVGVDTDDHGSDSDSIPRMQPLLDLGIPAADAGVLVAHGFDSAEKLASASVGDLLPLPRIGKTRAERYITAAVGAVFSPVGDTVPETPPAFDSLED